MRRAAILAAVCFMVPALSGQAYARSRRPKPADVIEKEWVGYFDIKGKILLVRDIRGITADLPKSEDYWWYVKYSNYKGPKQRLRFTKTRDPGLEKAYARHFVWPGKGPFHPPPAPGEEQPKGAVPEQEASSNR